MPKKRVHAKTHREKLLNPTRRVKDYEDEGTRAEVSEWEKKATEYGRQGWGICPNGHGLPFTWSFCDECGLPSDRSRAVDAKCAKCGRKRYFREKFCPDDGLEFGKPFVEYWTAKPESERLERPKANSGIWFWGAFVFVMLLLIMWFAV